MGSSPLTKEKVRALRAEERLVRQFQRPLEKADEVVHRERLLATPVKKSREAQQCLEQILPEMLARLSPYDRRDVRQTLTDVIKLARKRIEELDELD